MDIRPKRVDLARNLEDYAGLRDPRRQKHLEGVL
jgi:hypothetical protein